MIAWSYYTPVQEMMGFCGQSMSHSFTPQGDESLYVIFSYLAAVIPTSIRSLAMKADSKTGQVNASIEEVAYYNMILVETLVELLVEKGLLERFFCVGNDQACLWRRTIHASAIITVTNNTGKDAYADGANCSAQRVQNCLGGRKSTPRFALEIPTNLRRRLQGIANHNFVSGAQFS
jgi:hypothetical protein